MPSRRRRETGFVQRIPQIRLTRPKYKLDLDDEWNKEYLPHRGRHPNEYHDFVLQGMRESDAVARGNQASFLEQFEARVKQPVRENPGMLRKAWWTE
jgi:hypothetical protein